MRAFARSTLAWLAVATGGALAADPAPAPREGAAAAPIATARKEFESLRSARSNLDPGTLDVPKLNTPTLHLNGDEASEWARSEEARRAEKEKTARKQANWLVDAMDPKSRDAKERKSGRRGASGAEDRDDSDATEAEATGALDLSRPRERDREHAQADAREAPTAPALDNPLTQYMSGWMTARDFELLKVKSGDAADAAGSSGNTRPGPVVRSGAATSSARVPLPGFGEAESNAGLGAHAPNPYLEDVALPTRGEDRDTGPVPAFSPPPTARAPVLLLPQNDPRAPAAEQKRPEAFKPASDAKYFPQLKRF